MAAQTWKNKESVKGYSQTEILQKKKTHIIFLPKFPSDCKKSLLTSKKSLFCHFRTEDHNFRRFGIFVQSLCF